MDINLYGIFIGRIKEFKILYLILLFIYIILVLIYSFISQISILENIIAGFIGIFITVLFVDTFIEYSKEKENIEQKKKIFSLIKHPSETLISEMYAVYKNLNNNKSNGGDILVKTFFEKNLPEVIDGITNFYSISNGTNIISGNLVQISWIAWLKKINDRFVSDVEKLISKYAYFLDTNIVELFENLKNSEYYRLIESANTVRIDNLQDLNLGDKFREHNKIIIKLISVVFWHDQIYIKKDKDRINIMVDFDNLKT